MPKKLSIAELEKHGGIMQILIVLCNWKGPKRATMSEIRKAVNVHFETLQNDIALLKRLELVEDEKAKKLPYEHTVWLTEKGKRVALHLEQAALALGHLSLSEEEKHA